MKFSTSAVGIVSTLSNTLVVAAAVVVAETTTRRSSLYDDLLKEGGSSSWPNGRSTTPLVNRSGPRKTNHHHWRTGLPSTARTTTATRRLEDRVECRLDNVIDEEVRTTTSRGWGAAADVGVLGGGCGYHEICAAHANSTMGGYCYRLYAIPKVCDPSFALENSIYDDTVCDCSEFDVASGTGFISCLYETRPMGSSYYGCYDINAQLSFTIEAKDNRYVSRGACSEFVVVGDDTTNTTTKLCTTFDNVDGNPFRTSGSSCELQIDGQLCASCTYTVDVFQWPLPMEILEATADCSNVVDGLTVDGFNEFVNLPIIQACYQPINGTFCDNMCVNDTYIYLADPTPISLEGFGSDFTCAGLDRANYANQLSAAKCPEATALAQAECCTSSIYITSPTSDPSSAPGANPTAASSAATAGRWLVSAGILFTTSASSFMLAMN